MTRIINATLKRLPNFEIEYKVDPLNPKPKTTKKVKSQINNAPFKVSELKPKKLKSLKKSKIKKSKHLLETKKLWSYKEDKLLNKAQIYLKDGWEMKDAIQIIIDSKAQSKRYHLTVVRDLAS